MPALRGFARLLGLQAELAAGGVYVVAFPRPACAVSDAEASRLSGRHRRADGAVKLPLGVQDFRQQGDLRAAQVFFRVL